MKKQSKKDEYIEYVEKEKFCAYIDHKLMTVGVYADPKLMLKANKFDPLKKLKGRFKYKIQMVIPN